MRSLTGRILLLGAALLVGGCGDEPPSVEPRPMAEVPSPAPSKAEPVAVPAPAPSKAEPAAIPATAPSPPQPETLQDDVQAAADREPVQHKIVGVVTQWRPLVLFAQPGDVVVFRQMTGHDTETMEGLYPDGAAPWRSKLGEEGFSITLKEPGAYIYKCNPHSSSGMIGAIVVGPLPPDNLAELESSPLNKGMTARTIRKLKQALESAAN